MVEIRDIKACFSKQLDWIKDPELQEKVVIVRKKAIDIRGGKSLDEHYFLRILVFSPSIQKESQL